MKPADHIEKFLENMIVTSDPDRNSRMLAAVLQAQAEVNEKRPERKNPELWRTIMQSKTFRISAAAVIVAAVLVSLTVLPTQSAYANVADQLRQARTFTFTWIKQTNLQPNDSIAVQVAYKAPGYIRTTTPDGAISVNDTTQGKMLILIPKEQAYMSADYKNMPKNQPDLTEYIRQLQNLPAEADEKLAPKEINGVKAEGYRIIKKDTIMTLWIDAGTQKLIQFEQEFPSSPGMNFILQDIRLDVALDDSLFSLTPPPGYKQVANVSADAAEVTEADLIAYFKMWIDVTKDNTFPPVFVGPEFRKVVMELEEQGKFARPWTQEDRQVLFKGGIFLRTIPEEDWRYTGQNVPFGDPEKPVFWYCPDGSKVYRVIYADLSVREVTAENLPQ